MTLEANAARFSGFADLYDRVRPTPPGDLGRLLCSYAGAPDAGAHVVDLGAGSGLSTRWCATWAGQVTAVEPSADMRAVATASLPATASIVEGWSHATGLPDGCADVVVAVQALHWMEPTTTFAEVARILRPGGVFAALDCDWPPSLGNVDAEAAWSRCRAIVRAYEERLAAGQRGADLTAPLDQPASLPEHFGRDPNKGRTMAVGVQAWSKDAHLARMRESGRFRHSVEVAAHTVEPGDARRAIDLLRSQGDHQTLLKQGLTEAQLGIPELEQAVRTALGDGPRSFWFTYRVRIGVT